MNLRYSSTKTLLFLYKGPYFGHAGNAQLDDYTQSTLLKTLYYNLYKRKF